MSKKNRKSLFTWCIRALAVSLLPTLVLVSCADDSSDKATPVANVAPFVDGSDPASGETIVSTSNFSVTFSEAVKGLVYNASDGSCSGTVQLADANKCYGISVATSDNLTYTINPKSNLPLGSDITLTISKDITDLEGLGMTTNTVLSFTVQDALTTVAVNLEKDLLAAGLTAGTATSLSTAARTAASSVDNDLASVIPAAVGGAIEAVDGLSLSAADESKVYETLVESAIAQINGIESLSDSSARSAEFSISELNTLLEAVIEVIIAKAPDAAAIKSATKGMAKGAGKAGLSTEELTNNETGALAKISVTFVLKIAASDREDLDKAAAVKGASEGLTAGVYAIEAITDKTASVDSVKSNVSGAIDESEDADLIAAKDDIAAAIDQTATEEETTAADTTGEDTAADTTGEDTAADTTGEDTAADTTGEDTGEDTTTDTTGEDTGEDTTDTTGTTDGTAPVPDTTAPSAPTISISPIISSVKVINNSSTTYTNIVNSTSPTLSITSNESGSYSISGCGTSSGTLTAATTKAVTLSVNHDSTNTCIVTVTDDAGNTSAASSISFRVDSIGPSASLTLQSYFTGDEDQTDNASSLTQLYAQVTGLTDSWIGVKGYHFDTSSTAPSSSSSVWTLSDNISGLGSSDTALWEEAGSQGNAGLDNHSLGQDFFVADNDDNETKTVYLHMLDFAGNVETISDSIFFLPDGDAPTIDNVTIQNVGLKAVDNATYTNQREISVEIYARDDKSGLSSASYHISETALTSSEVDNGSYTFTSVSFTDNVSTITGSFLDNTSEGTHTVYFWVKDGAGNLSDNYTTDTIIVDNNTPNLDTVSIVGETADGDNATYTDNTSYTDNLTLSFSLTFNDDNGTVNSEVYWYHINEDGSAPGEDDTSAWLPLDNNSYLGDGVDNQTQNSWNADNNTVSYTASAEGVNKSFYVWVRDNATNISSSVVDNITIDLTAPTASGTAVDFSDNLSSDGSYYYSNTTSVTLDNDTLFTDSGVGLSSYFITDNDSETPAYNDGSWIAADDARTFTLSAGNQAIGLKTIYVWAKDYLGNVIDNASKLSKTFYYDNSAPTFSDNVTASVSSGTLVNADNNTFYTQVSPVTINLSSSDNYSVGYFITDNDSYTPTSSDFLASGDWIIQGSSTTLTLTDNTSTNYLIWARDYAGNQANIDNLTIVYDAYAPYMDNFTLIGTTGGSDNTTDTDNSTLRIDFSGAADNGYSGLAYYYASEDGAASDATILAGKQAYKDPATYVLDNASPGVQTVYAWLIDNASNISSPYQDNITVSSDNSSPVINSSIKINNNAPALSNATYINSVSVTVEVNATDNQSGVMYWHANADNNTPSGTDTSLWTAFTTPGANVSENVTIDNISALTNASAGDGVKNVYLFVKNGQDNVSLSSFDNTTLDTTAPVDNATAAKLTGSVASTSNADNQSYTASPTVTLDNFTSWVDEDGSGLTNGQYFIIESGNYTTAPAYTTTGWQDWDNLSLTFGADWNGTGTLGNSTVGQKTIYVWTKDNASNVSARTDINITFDNETPDWSGVGYTLFDSDNSSDNATYNNLYTNSATITILDNLTAYDNESGVNGTGIVAYFFTDNVTTATNLRDNTSGWQSGSSYGVNLDNTTNRLVTIYGYAKDLAGNISDNATQTIAFDNATPVIDNITWDSSQIQVADTQDSGNVTLLLSATDNSSGFTSGFKDFYVAYKINRKSNGSALNEFSATDDNISNVSDASWISATDIAVTDNGTFDNATYTLSFVDSSAVLRTDGQDNYTVVVWFRDNASNVSENRTIVFSDNSTVTYKNF